MDYMCAAQLVFLTTCGLMRMQRTNNVRPFQYIMDIRNKLNECTEIARENAVSSQSKFTTYFDLKVAD